MRLLSKSLLCLAFLSFVFIQSTTAQKKKKLPKFGKVSNEELDMNAYDLDPEARAVILFDKGELYFTFDQIDGFKTVMKRHVRIKILNKTGFDWGDFAIPFYESNRGEIKAQSIKGLTVYKENGAIKEAKLEKEDIFEEETGRYWRLKKFSMPQLKENCVIDLTYELVSSFLSSLPDWQFQYDIPVVWSQHQTSIPEYFKYNQNSQGYLPMKIYETSTGAGSLSFMNKRNGNTTAPGTAGRVENLRRVQYVKNNSFFAMSDVPALKAEPYTSSMRNFYTTVFFELAQTTFPGQFNNNITTTWDDIDESIMQDISFGGQIRKGSFLKEEVLAVKNKYDTPIAQIAAIYEYIKSQVSWDKNYGENAQSGISKALKEGKGNVGDVNLMLTAALRNAGFDASPVLLSTRSHGFIPITRPSSSCFNYVVTGVKLDGEMVLLDATSKNSTAGMLPKRCLNGKGRWMHEDGCEWVDLTKTKKHDTVTQYNVEMNENMELNGSITCLYKDYSAYDYRIEVEELGSSEAVTEAIQDENTNLKIHEEAIEYADLYVPVKAQYEMTYTDAITQADRIIYVNPMLSEAMTENPFKSESRLYPVNFAYPIKDTYLFKMPIPEGYEVEELPEKMVIALPGKSGKYTYTATLVNGVMNIISKLEIRKSIFLPEDYPYLREFYDQAIEKQAEQIVLRKL